MSLRHRVAIDSNDLISAALSATSSLQAIWNLPDVDVLVSSDVLQESSRHLDLPPLRARLWHLLYRSHVVPDAEEILLPDWVNLPEKDQPVLKAAIKADAGILVTGDYRHFGALFGRRVPPVLIESTTMFKSRYPEHFRMERPGR